MCRAPSQYIKRLVCIFASSEAAVVLVFYVTESKSSGAHRYDWVKFLWSATATRRRTRARCGQLDHSHKPRGSLTGFPRARLPPLLLTRARCAHVPSVDTRFRPRFRDVRPPSTNRRTGRKWVVTGRVSELLISWLALNRIQSSMTARL